MKFFNCHRLKKTILYRISALAIMQCIAWIITRNVTVNAIVLVTGCASTIWYYIFETIYKRVEKNGQKS